MGTDAERIDMTAPAVVMAEMEATEVEVKAVRAQLDIIAPKESFEKGDDYFGPSRTDGPRGTSR